VVKRPASSGSVRVSPSRTPTDLGPARPASPGPPVCSRRKYRDRKTLVLQVKYDTIACRFHHSRVRRNGGQGSAAPATAPIASIRPSWPAAGGPRLEGRVDYAPYSVLSVRGRRGAILRCSLEKPRVVPPAASEGRVLGGLPTQNAGYERLGNTYERHRVYVRPEGIAGGRRVGQARRTTTGWSFRTEPCDYYR
jgi:hypothetical protein